MACDGNNQGNKNPRGHLAERRLNQWEAGREDKGAGEMKILCESAVRTTTCGSLEPYPVQQKKKTPR